MNFLVYANKLRQWVPSLSPEQADDFINDAWRDIREANDRWSFLLGNEYWMAPGGITLQGLGVTQFSNIVTLSYSALLLIGGLNNPPITDRQLRFTVVYEIESTDALQVEDGAITIGTDDLTSASGPFEASHVGRKIIVEGAGPGGGNLESTITIFVSPTQVTLANNATATVSNAQVTWGATITLSRVYNEDTNSNSTALLYRIYYSPLTTDFHRLDHLTDPITGYEFGYREEICPIDILDRMDPQRSSSNQPWRLFLHHFDSVSGLPVYEMWPGPTGARAYTVTFWKLGTSFADDSDSLPPQIQEELLLMRAKILAYEYGASSDPDFRKRASYQALANAAMVKYSNPGQPKPGLLERAITRDEEVALLSGKLQPRRSGPGWPIDSNFLQSHAFPGWRM